MKVIAVHTPEDKGSLHVRAADVAFELVGGRKASAESCRVLNVTDVCNMVAATPLFGYLDIDAVLGACSASGATALHPGYGFLSENPGPFPCARAPTLTSLHARTGLAMPGGACDLPRSLTRATSIVRQQGSTYTPVLVAFPPCCVSHNIVRGNEQIKARALAQSTGLPLLPASLPVSGPDDALRAANRLGFPVMLKASEVRR